MTIAIALAATAVLSLLVLIAAHVIDSPSTRARAAAEARGYDPRPARRRIPRSATLIVQPRHVLDPSTTGEVADEELITTPGLSASTEVD